MNKIILYAFIIISFLNIKLIGQSGKIFGIINGSYPLANVQVFIPEINQYTNSNNLGYYEFSSLPLIKMTLEFKHIGYKSIKKHIDLEETNNYELNIILFERIIELSEATVISSRNEQLVREISFPIEVINSTEIQSSNAITVSDMLKNESGISLIKDSPWATSINIRGLSKQNIVYLIDGNRIETSTNIAAGLSLIDMSSINSIEVVKGGLSSLYGTGATAGVINILSKKSEFKQNYYISSNLSNSYNSVNNASQNSIRINTGAANWTAAINGSLRKADNISTPNGVLQNSGYRDESINLSLNYQPVDNILTQFDFQKFSAFDVGIPGGSPFPESATAKYKYAKRDMMSGSISFNSITKSLLKSNIKYYHQSIERSVEVKPNKIVTSEPKATHTTNGLSIQTDWDINHHYFVAGIDYWQREYNGIRTITNKASDLIKVDKPVPNSRFSSIGIFAKDEFKIFNDKMKLSFSGRYDIITISNDETKNPLYIIKDGDVNYNSKIELASFEEKKTNNKSFSGGFGAIYNITKNYDITFNTGYNFRSPSLEERYQYIDLGGIVYLGNPNLKPEEGIFIDAGFRIWEDNLSFRANTFINYFSNLVQDLSIVKDSLFKKENIGEARLYGFDLSLDYNFTDQYLIYTTLAYVRGEDILSKTDLPEVPPLNGTVGIKFQLTNFLNIDLMGTYAFPQNNLGNGEDKTEGYTYFDINVITKKYFISFMNLKLIAGVHNIFNKEYKEHLSTYRGIKMYEPGRNIFIKLILDLE
ncbi:MAG: TonB-dependent receptor [Melioribacteraceae bacterium]|nr:TonB-dependent receptor [Melioribacteraceae bacterium]